MCVGPASTRRGSVEMAPGGSVHKRGNALKNLQQRSDGRGPERSRVETGTQIKDIKRLFWRYLFSVYWIVLSKNQSISAVYIEFVFVLNRSGVKETRKFVVQVPFFVFFSFFFYFFESKNE